MESLSGAIAASVFFISCAWGVHSCANMKPNSDPAKQYRYCLNNHEVEVCKPILGCEP